MSTDPSWLSDLFAAAMLAVAGFSLALLVVQIRSGRRHGTDVVVSHVAMGLAMAGMFSAALAFGATTAWEVVFAVLLVWFVVRSAESILTFGAHVPHFAIHATMSLAMLLLYWFPGAGAGMAMGGSASHAAHLDPGVILVLAGLFAGSAVFTLSSPVRGRAVYGSHLEALPEDPDSARPATASGGGVAVIDAPAVAPAATRTVLEHPRAADVSHAVMTVAMAFMLVLML